MSDRANQGLKPVPSRKQDVTQALEALRQRQAVTLDNPDDFDERMQQVFPDGFDHRDEANALIAMSVRNGPIENLHAGKSSPLLEDDTLSRMTDADIKAIMIHATRTLAMMLQLRDQAPDVYRRHMQKFGSTYCRAWERAT